jgi:hypothetical protein
MLRYLQRWNQLLAKVPTDGETSNAIFLIHAEIGNLSVQNLKSHNPGGFVLGAP